MSTTDFTMKMLVPVSSQETYELINDVRGWWADNFTGKSSSAGDEFEVRFRDVHYSKQRLTSMEPGKHIEWLVTDSDLTFLDKSNEWTGTKIRFDIAPKNGQTEISFTHEGLNPGIECYKDCSRGWTYYLQESLLPFINNGKGKPGYPEY